MNFTITGDMKDVLLLMYEQMHIMTNTCFFPPLLIQNALIKNSEKASLETFPHIGEARYESLLSGRIQGNSKDAIRNET